MIRVQYVFAGTMITKEFAQDNVTARILSAGTLRILEPAEYEVPPMGSDGKKKEAIVIKPEQTLAVFHGEYIMEVL